MRISVSQLSLIESSKRNATGAVIGALAKATKIPLELIELLAATEQNAKSKSSREIAETAHAFLALLAPPSGTSR
jgi:transcriptional regulator with XRE-family HTH domain